MATRTASAVWSGGLKDGNGRMKLGSGAYEGAYSFGSRFEEAPGTNPEELIGAAHAGCYSMALAAGLGKALRDNPSLKTCMINRLYSYSVGQKLGSEAEPRVERYQTALDAKGYRFDDMLRLMIFDTDFFAVRPLQPAAVAMTYSGGSHAHQK